MSMMTSHHVQKLAEAPCPCSSVPSVRYVGIDCPTCKGTGALVPGLRRECTREKLCLYARGVGHCGACLSRGWMLIPEAEVMGVLVRAAPAQIIIGEGNHQPWQAKVQFAWSDKSEWRFEAEGDTPEEALAHAIYRSLL